MAKKFRILYCSLFLSFLLGVHEGRLALWRAGDAKPIQVFPVPVSMLPELDQQALEAGIPVESFRQAMEALQDYLN